MQCTNCQFHNMPGSAQCGRCGTSLALAAAAIDVHPPRAGAFSKRFRRARPVARTYYEARDVMGDTGARTVWIFGQLAPSLPPAAVTLRLILPGWSHLYIGRRLAGHLFLWLFLLCLVSGLLFLGLLWGSVLLGLAFSIHSSAALDILSRDLPPGEVRSRMVRGILISAAMAFFLYWPLGRLLTSVADPQIIEMQVPPFLQEHDVLLVNHWISPRIGQIVLYDIPELRADTGGTGHERNFTHFVGPRIDRILAGPGDVVRWDGQQLLVNGAVSQWSSVNLMRATGTTNFTVPEAHYFILPSTSPGARGPAALGLWAAIGLVPFNSIHGGVYLRSHPFWRREHLK